jgi:hypothetical protein
MTLDYTVSFDTFVTFVNPLVALMMSLHAMQCEDLSNVVVVVSHWIRVFAIRHTLPTYDQIFFSALLV